jgi:hypothetical protein
MLDLEDAKGIPEALSSVVELTEGLRMPAAS